MNDYLGNFIQHGGQLDSFLAAAALWVGFAALGSVLIGPGQSRDSAPFLGWALVSMFFTAFGVLSPVPFTYLAVAAAVAAVAAGFYAWRREGGPLPAGSLKIAMLAAPLILLVSAMIGSQWDEFSDWLITPRLLLQTDAFPNRQNAHLSGSLAAYPFGWHYVTYLTSRLAGRLVENAGALINVFMLLTFGLISARLIRAGAGYGDDRNSVPGWGLCALGALLATLLNTTFAQKVAPTSYADVATAATAAIGGLIGWYMLAALAEGRRQEAGRYALQFGLMMMLLVNLKQSTLALFVLVTGAVILAGLRDPLVKLRELARLSPSMMVPPVAIYVLWRYYVSNELPGGEFAIRPMSGWLLGYIPEILTKMLIVLSKKGAYLALMTIAVGFGVRAMIRFRTPFDRLAIIVAAVFIGHNAFLLFAYVTAFGKADALRVASFWRYNMQVGLLAVIFTAYGLGLAWKTWGAGRFRAERLAWLPVILILLAPFVFANKLRFDRYQPVPYFRAIGAEMNGLLSSGDRLIVFDPKGTGESGVITRYEMGGTDIFQGFTSAFHKPSREGFLRLLSGDKYSHILVYSVTADVTAAVNLDLAADRSYLLAADGAGGWRIVRSWRVPVPDR